jgi:general stress protein YciG
MADDTKGMAKLKEEGRDDEVSEIASKGGQASSSQQDMSKLGQKGGKAAQESGNAHELTSEEQSAGGSASSGNFKNDPQRASDAAKSRNEE